MRKIERIYLHCSYSEWGDVETIRHWHMDPLPDGNGWSDIGYHFVIYNPFSTFNQLKNTSQAVAEADLENRLYATHTDGLVVTGRPIVKSGAHVKYDNKHSIGIVYVGICPTAAQWSAMLVVCRDLIMEYPLLTVESVLGHYEYYIKKGETIKKSCPNFNMDTFRGHLKMMF